MISGTGGTIATSVVENREINGGDLLKSAIIGGVSGGLGSASGSATQTLVKSANKGA